MVWTKYISTSSSIVMLYFKGTYDVISVAMAMPRSTNVSSKFQFL